MVDNGIKFASIDIGSNAIRLLFCRVINDYNNQPTFTKEALFRMPLRLGEDAFSIGKISKKNKSKLFNTIKAYKLMINAYEPASFKSCATAALRTAKNGKEIVKEINAKIGLNIEIISGKEEAEIIMSNHIEKHLNQNKHYVYIDVGGGSTEISFISNLKKSYSKSFPIGSVRLLNNMINKNEWPIMKNWILNKRKEINGEIIAIGSGGNINKIFSMSKETEKKEISIDTIIDIINKIKPYSINERITKLGMRPDRADVIDHAGKIYISAMRWIRSSKIIVPQSGLPDGIIHKIFNEYNR